MDLNLENLFTKNTRILVTGGAGFIGGCLIRRLLSDTDATIFNLDKFSYASDLSWLDFQKNKSNHNLLKIDLKDLKNTKDAIDKIDPDFVFHLAAESHVDRSINGPQAFIESNIIGTFNLLTALKIHWEKLKSNRKERFRLLHISTDEVFGSLSDYGQFNERTRYDPRSPYSSSKASSDHLMKAWHHTYNMPIIVTNCSNNFGPWQYPEKLIPVVISKILNNKKIPIYGNGLNVRDWLYVEDHINALILIARDGIIGSSYCIGGHGEMNNLELVNEICKMLDKKIRKNDSSKLIEFVDDRKGHDKRYSIDSSLIKKNFNWKPQNNFKHNLEITINWYLDNQHWFK